MKKSGRRGRLATAARFAAGIAVEAAAVALLAGIALLISALGFV